MMKQSLHIETSQRTGISECPLRNFDKNRFQLTGKDRAGHSGRAV
jgi:hypothetical protein